MTLSVGEQGEIVGMWKSGRAPAEIARSVGQSRATVGNVIKRYRERGNYEPKKSPGRPKKLDARAVRQVVSIAKRNRRATLTDITNVLAVEVSRSTVRRTLHREGIFSRVAIVKPFLSDRHKQARLVFARQYRHWTAEDWKKVVWTDESSFEIGKTFRKIRVWRTKDEKYRNDCLAPSFKSGRTSVMVWGAFGGSTMSNLITIPPDSKKAVDFVHLIYDGELLGFMGQVTTAILLEDWEDEHGPVLMEDGAPIHTALVSRNWREEHGIVKLMWPACSPDLNPIENVWAQLKDAVQNRRVRPRSIGEMVAALNEEWMDIRVEFLTRLYSGLPGRLQAVITAQGGHTRW